jgi:uncharacterized membrane protein
MHFANPISLWLALLAAAAIGGVALFSYRRPLVPLTPGQRAVLIALRASGLSLVVLCLCRPIVLRPPSGSRDIVVPVLVDVSRSMAIADASGQARLTRAVQALKTDILPSLAGRFTPEIYGIGDGLMSVNSVNIARLTATARQSALTSAIAAVRERYRGRRISGIVLISDGGETTTSTGASTPDAGVPVFTIGVGSPDGVRDREVVGMTAGDPQLDQASVDLDVIAVSRGYGRAPFDLHVLANGRPVETRRLVPAADGSPIDEIFTVSPDPFNPTVYSAEIAPAADEAITANNARSVLVSPAGRKRRVLVLEGAPGFEHSFLTRALSEDAGLEIDAVVRKGKNDAGQDTFFVQAGAGRAAALTAGFPARREDLYAYDALILANVEGDFFTRAQLATAADFVSARGGGLLVLGGRSFDGRSLIGTPLEDVLPVELGDRRGATARAAFGADTSAPRNSVALTPEGENHPITRIGPSLEDTRKRWAALPPLAGSAALGAPRPGATVLAVTTVAGGAVYPVVAVQRYGSGRSMVFGGEASWRWRMLQPSTDRSYEFFWRQAVRWLAAAAPDPVAITAPDAAEPGDSIEIGVDALDAAFLPVTDADVTAVLTRPGGKSSDSTPLALRREAGGTGRFTAVLSPGDKDDKGLYHVHADARRGTTPLGAADRWFYVGGSDRELADPRLNEGTLRRIARSTGGRYVPVADASQVAPWLEAAIAETTDLEQQDLWQEPWMFALVIALLSTEWILRRRWGLR